jgi:hypothetical protein
MTKKKIKISLKRKSINALLNFVMLVLNISILVYVMVNLVSEKLYRLGITQIGILLKNKLTIEVGKI